ncbi:MAG: hypothetical protein RBT32_03905 [Methanothermobacter sp.]|uniref:hypothetical protein n=1 Tax=Methanothermobacter tenebrarum TaxID=680118 RepID=UPI0020C17E10|nr:hypothetical protein [Methanothermobacter tenebrarum]MDD3454533.1 hypothetical protein [Methanobacteriales archaeon]MDX9693255.1 hypothetical protein [Methanothermobacter sp.]
MEQKILSLPGLLLGAVEWKSPRASTPKSTATLNIVFVTEPGAWEERLRSTPLNQRVLFIVDHGAAKGMI